MPAILAQTFFVDGTLYREGVFVSSVDLFFANKDSSGILPVEVQLRQQEMDFLYQIMPYPYQKSLLMR